MPYDPEEVSEAGGRTSGLREAYVIYITNNNYVRIIAN